MSENQELTFEEAFGRLGAIVKKLEEGELSLDESMVLFEEGIGLERLCEQRLNQAELKINGFSRRNRVLVEETVPANVVLVPRSMGNPLRSPAVVSLKALNRSSKS